MEIIEEYVNKKEISYYFKKNGIQVGILKIIKEYDSEFEISESFITKNDVNLEKEDYIFIKEQIEILNIKNKVIYSTFKMKETFSSVKELTNEIKKQMNEFYIINNIKEYGNIKNKGYNFVDEPINSIYKFYRINCSNFLQMSFHDAVYKAIKELEEEDSTVEFLSVEEYGFYKSKVEIRLNGSKIRIEFGEYKDGEFEFKIKINNFKNTKEYKFEFTDYEDLCNKIKIFINEEYKKQRLENLFAPNYFYSKAYLSEYTDLDEDERKRLLEFIMNELGKEKTEILFSKMKKNKIKSYDSLKVNASNFVSRISVGNHHFGIVVQNSKEIEIKYFDNEIKLLKNFFKEKFDYLVTLKCEKQIENIFKNINTEMIIKEKKNII